MNTGKKNLLVLAIFGLITLFIFRPYFFKHQVPFPANLLISTYQPWTSYPNPDYPNGAPNKPMGFDNLRIFYPLKTLAISLVKQGQPPLWNPYAFSGNTLLGTYQSAIFFPLNWLFFILPQIDAWSIIVMLQPILTGFFMYLFLDSLGLSFSSSLFGSLTFAFSGFAIVWWQEAYMSGYSLMVLPLLLFAINKLRQQVNLWRWLLLTLALVWTIVSGWFQMTLYVLIFTAIYLVYLLLSKKISWRVVWWIKLAGFFAILISAAHLIPSLEALKYSARGTTDAKFLFNEYLLPLKYLATLIAPDFFGNPAVYKYYSTGFYYERMLYFGLIPLILALNLLIFGWKKREIRFWSICFLVFLSLGLALPTSWFLLYSLKIPLLSVIIPSRILVLSAFCGSVLSAYGLTVWAAEKRRWKLLVTSLLVTIALGAMWYWAYLLKKHDPVGEISALTLRNLVVPTGFFGLGMVSLWLLNFLRKQERLRKVIVIAVSLGASLYFANKYLYFSDRRLVYPQTPVIAKLKELSGVDRFWSFGAGQIENNFATQFALYSPEGYDSIFIRRYGELLDAATHQGKLRADISRADALINSTDRIDTIFQDPFRKRLLEILGVKYLVASNTPPKNVREQMLVPPELKLIWRDQVYSIYENQTVLPRAFIVGNYQVISDNSQILTTFFAQQFDPSQTVILEATPAGFTPNNQFQGQAEVIRYQPNQVEITTETKAPAILVLSDNYYPGWRADVDGVEFKIYRADYTFRAVVVPAGKHQIVFRYQPDSWKAGVAGSILGFLILAVVSLYLRAYDKKIRR